MSDEILALILSTAGAWVGLWVQWTRRAWKQHDQAVADLRAAHTKLIEELRRDIEEKTIEAQAALQTANDTSNRMTALELSAIDKDEKIAALERQLNTVLTQLEAVQAQQEATKKALNGQRAENERLRAENKALEKQHTQLFESNKLLMMENKTYEKAFTMLGLRLAEEPDPPPPPSPKPPKISPVDFKQEPKEKLA
jgi:chromosome segregation ATPase